MGLGLTADDEGATVEVQAQDTPPTWEAGMEFEGKNVRVTNHCREMIIRKGFDAEKVRRAIVHPERVTDVLKHPGQVRAIGEGLAVVLAPAMRGAEWVAVTVYEDGVLTPPRADQMNTPEGRRYAKRYAAGLGRG